MNQQPQRAFGAGSLPSQWRLAAMRLADKPRSLPLPHNLWYFYLMAQDQDFFDRIQHITEAYLGYRRRKLRVKKEKLQAKNPILDWIEAFLWAAGMVLLINQYLFQAYQIPSGSMIDTLLIGDRIFVNKFIYGPELLPGYGKLPSPVKPRRNDVIIFENPTYNSRGTAFDIAQRIIFMLTLSFIDIDRDESGNPQAHFLIKRAAGMGGDWFVPDKGNMRVRFAGESQWADEREFINRRGMGHKLGRLMKEADYPVLETAGRSAAYADLGFPVQPGFGNEDVGRLGHPDFFAYEKARLEVIRGAYPNNMNYRTRLARNKLGWYVPEGRILPLGDNRDNSRDGRFFGSVKSSKILGKGSVIIWSWPMPGRIGPIR
ncbi:MAG: S26 family signal peptidase [Treponema sp.]|nr:S26 family signal peptidase [Treponema sp.]